jgi:hypothetical protein
MAVLQRVQFVAAQSASQQKVSGPSMMPARITAAAGVLSLFLALPGAAQTTGPADGGVQRNDQSGRTDPAPSAPREVLPERERKAAPPARTTDDEFDLPPAGCRYRENKLDLIV